MSILHELGRIQEVIDIILELTKDSTSLPQSGEQVLVDLKSAANTTSIYQVCCLLFTLAFLPETIEMMGKVSFLPHDAIHSMDYTVARCLSVHLSVCLSHVMAKHTIQLFSLWPSDTILVILYQTLWQYSDRDRVTESSNAGGMKKS